ncbi:MAG: rhamnan synthesis F family protein [Candidatus Cryptobacteroides sp.]
MTRLFLFAGYDGGGSVGPSLVYYCSRLKEAGDVVIRLDSDCDEEGLDSLKPFVLHAEAGRHGEYDFGSYKRTMEWAVDNLDAEAYDWIYLVNDSVFGPVSGIVPVLERMEALGTDVTGLVFNPHRRNPHLQSWFIGMRREVFASDFLREFLKGVVRLQSKEEVCIRYEEGFTRMLSDNGVTFSGLYSAKGKEIYNKPLGIIRKGIPFIKKSSFTRHKGCLGRRLRLVLGQADPALVDAIRTDIDRIHGAGCFWRLTTGGPATMLKRYFNYLAQKCINIT